MNLFAKSTPRRVSSEPFVTSSIPAQYRDVRQALPCCWGNPRLLHSTDLVLVMASLCMEGCQPSTHDAAWRTYNVVQSPAWCTARAETSHLATLRQDSRPCASQKHTPWQFRLPCVCSQQSGRPKLEQANSCGAVPVEHMCPDKYDEALLLSFPAEHPMDAFQGCQAAPHVPQTYMLQD